MLRRFFMLLVALAIAAAMVGPDFLSASEGASATVRCTSGPGQFLAPVGIAGDSLIATSSYEFAVESFSLDDCSLNWRLELGPQFGETYFTPEVTYVATNALSPSPDGYTFAAVDNRTGAAIWTKDVARVTEILAVVNGIIITSPGPIIQGVGAKNGTVIWEQPFWISSQGMAVDNDAIVGFTNIYASLFRAETQLDQEIISIDISTGNVNWRQSVEVTDNISVQDTRDGVLVTSDRIRGETSATGWDLSSGAAIWRHVVGDVVCESCRYDGLCVIGGSNDDPNRILITGGEFGESTLDIPLDFSPITGTFRGNHIVVIGSCADPFEHAECPTQYARIDLSSGKVMWTQDIGGKFMFPILDTDVIYQSVLVYFDQRSGIAAMDEESGRIVWNYEVPKGCATAGFKVSDGTVALIVSTDQSGGAKVYVLDAPLAR